MKNGAIFEFIDIVEIVADVLAAVRWKASEKNCFENCFDAWRDIEHLEEFFESFKLDLERKEWKLTVEQAVNKVLEEADFLEQRIVAGAVSGDLDGLVFKALNKNEMSYKKVATKAYGGGTNGIAMLRLYAVRVNTNCYLITGGAIKLTDSMQERKHTQEELDKLTFMIDVLKTGNVDDASDYGYLEMERN